MVFTLTRRTVRLAGSFIRGFKKLTKEKKDAQPVKRANIKVAFIHNEKRLLTGAGHINQIMSLSLAKRGAVVKNFYPRQQLADTPIHMRGIANILFFHSLLDKKDEMLKFNIIQGTTYTPLPFISFDKITISHFGSTNAGYIKCTPRAKDLEESERKVYEEFKKCKIVPDVNLKTRRPLRDIADMEKIVATRVSACIATSEKVRNELIASGVSSDAVTVIHNAIEDYWFEEKPPVETLPPGIVFLGRMGGDVFNLKLKGVDRLVNLYRKFPEVPKTTVCMTTNKKLKDWLKVSFPNHYMFVNMRKDLIPGILSRRAGSILFISSRYEGFSLSLIEGMSQGLVPVTFPVGVAPEIIENGVNGYLVGSTEEAQERIAGLLADQDKRALMSAEAKMTATQFWSEKIADRLMSLYRTVRYEKKNGYTADSAS